MYGEEAAAALEEAARGSAQWFSARTAEAAREIDQVAQHHNKVRRADADAAAMSQVGAVKRAVVMTEAAVLGTGFVDRRLRQRQAALAAYAAFGAARAAHAAAAAAADAAAAAALRRAVDEAVLAAVRETEATMADAARNAALAARTAAEEKATEDAKVAHEGAMCRR